MDFRTRPISREFIRELARIFRKFFGCTDKYFFDVTYALELLPVKLGNVTYQIVSNDDPELKDAPATTIPDMKGNYTIKIKEIVYEGAYYRNVGGYRNHIMHEICHVLLFTLGFKPYFDRTYKNNELKPYESVEWQAKALAGEMLIPYEITKNMSVEEIMVKCKVSKDAALKRLNIK